MYWDDDFALEEYGGSQWSIWRELRETIHAWQDTYREYWALGDRDPGDWLTAEQAVEAKTSHGVAVAILKMIPGLTVAGAAASGKVVNLTESQVKSIRKVLRSQKGNPAVSDWIALRLAEDFSNQIDGASSRAFRLVGVLRGGVLSERAASYLSRVTTLYIGGLELEAGVMCRAALEAALHARLDDQIPTDAAPPSLDAMLQMAGESGALAGYRRAPTRRGWKPDRASPLHQADRLRRVGNFIMHEFARYPDEEGEIRDAFNAVRALSLVLGALFPAPSFE